MKKILLMLTIALFISGCSSKIFKEQGPSDASNFQATYNLIESNNKIVYITLEEVKDLIENESGILLLGNPNENYSKEIASPLVEVTNTINTNVYYYELTQNSTELKTLLNSISEVNSSNNLETPILLFIKNGKINDYIYGKTNTSLINKNYDALKQEILSKYTNMQ